MITQLKPLISKLGLATHAALEAAATLAMSSGHYEVKIEHWLVRLCERADSDLDRILTGEAGVGKTAVVEGLALMDDGEGREINFRHTVILLTSNYATSPTPSNESIRHGSSSKPTPRGPTRADSRPAPRRCRYRI